jgi:hypothetical protein
MKKVLSLVYIYLVACMLASGQELTNAQGRFVTTRLAAPEAASPLGSPLRSPFPNPSPKLLDFWGNYYSGTVPGGPNYTRRGVLLLTGIDIGTSIMDVEAHQHCAHLGTCAEGNVYMPGGRAGEYAVKAALVGLTTLMGFALRRAPGDSRINHFHRKLWWYPQTLLAAGNTYGFSTSVRYFK